ncbi:MAG: HAD hydrolase-like protein, partial [Burkholderiales bacterium]|nr:HAD hydrolase-like protein [Burkholderiales bacterium]
EAQVRAADSLAGAATLFDQHYQARCGTRSQLYPQVRETLLALRSRGVKLAVVTNKEGRYTATVLNAHQLLPLLDRVVSGDTLPTKKPDPARNAGVPVWALPYGYNMGQPIAACAPDRIIADCSALLNQYLTNQSLHGLGPDFS